MNACSSCEARSLRTPTHSPIAYLGRAARRLRVSWTRWQAARELEAMPFDVRKDVGWPASDVRE